MNIFYFTNDVKLNAKLLDDKRLVKMVLETTQLLSNALYIYGKKAPYKPTHLHHPCTIWASKSKGNWLWLRRYGLALSVEYAKRFHRIHKCHIVIKLMRCPKMENKEFTQPEQCMPDKYKCKKSCRAYIKYYVGEKFNIEYFKRTDKKILMFWLVMQKVLSKQEDFKCIG